MNQNKSFIAYFSMEFALDDRMPNFAGGLGILAADTLYTAADQEQNLIGVSLVYHQSDIPEQAFQPEKILERCDVDVTLPLEERHLKIAIWKMEIEGQTGFKVPIYFLSTNVPENSPDDQAITRQLYDADPYRRLCQEIVLGIGGSRALKALGYDIDVYHLNEGHAALLTLENSDLVEDFDAQTPRKKCTFTTHTPIRAGHDYFQLDLVEKLLHSIVPSDIRQMANNGNLGMTELALKLTDKANAVSQNHQRICHQMFPDYHFESITNGVNIQRWVSPQISQLLDKYLPGWSENPNLLAQAPEKLSSFSLMIAHQRAKDQMVSWLNAHPDQVILPKTPGVSDFALDPDILTIGFARRLVTYKRPGLIFSDLGKLLEIGEGKLQFIFSGNCHPNDEYCKNFKQDLIKLAQSLCGKINIVLIPNYQLDIAKRVIAGCDIWLNNPLPPMEACGTSGMKAALNGVLNLSILDGWWIEGHNARPMSGWAFGKITDLKINEDHANRDAEDFADLMIRLEEIIHCYYHEPDHWAEKMKQAIALLSYFNTQRMLNEYQEKMWS